MTDEIRWCKHNKNGIRLIEPNENLTDAYFKKAEDALLTMKSIESPDWIISTGYYAMYYSLYALLMKAGIKSGIHTCTIECMRECLGDYFSESDIEAVENARKTRIQSQYYTTHELKEQEISEILSTAPKFLLKCRHISGLIKTKDIEKIRQIILEK
ncbi:HEPN domain-containing protein [Methanoplanus sp. FWC-SCC4]|uniref:HEPN domain-containing protein n=1 Tax=Methanochimaera problematica TaxID=2609417 RepID=A0AA97F9G9_9EURY|nr:HEPN domain-containing protein [Methanoplanus sp. FWC-SCC4]WOF15275.1 HEPN domain-containing protein [Methanoplanus sp. FWC-SCC4]